MCPSTAPPCMICRIPSNLGIPLLWSCTVIFGMAPCRGAQLHFGWSGLSFPRPRVQQNPPCWRGGPRVQHIPKALRQGCPGGREVNSQPVFMCSDTTRARLFHLSSFPLSQWRVQCLLASPHCCWQTLPGKKQLRAFANKHEPFPGTTTWVTEPLLVLEPAGRGSTGMDPSTAPALNPGLPHL